MTSTNLTEKSINGVIQPQKILNQSDIEDIESALIKATTPKNNRVGVFVVKTAKQAVIDGLNRPKKKKFGLFKERDFVVCFAPPGSGKSLFVVELGNGLALGVLPYGLGTCDPQIVLLIDFELDEEEWAERYSNENGESYEFPARFSRCEYDRPIDRPEKYKDSVKGYVIDSIEEAIKQIRPTILIIDNWSYLVESAETTKEANQLTDELSRLKKKYNLTLIAVGHTPKRDKTRPIELNDLKGSSSLSYYITNAFALGRSNNDGNIRYVKQVKVRGGVEEFDADNVINLELVKKDKFLGFNLLGYGFESSNLAVSDDFEKKEQIAIAKDLHKNNWSLGDIAKKLEKPKSTIQSWVGKR